MQSTSRTNPSPLYSRTAHHHPRALRGEACGLCWAQSGRRRRCPSHTTLRPDPALVRVQQHPTLRLSSAFSGAARCDGPAWCAARQNLLLRRLPLLLARHAAVMVIARATVHNVRDAERVLRWLARSQLAHIPFCRFAARKEEPPTCRLGSNPPLPLQHPDAACGG